MDATEKRHVSHGLRQISQHTPGRRTGVSNQPIAVDHEYHLGRVLQQHRRERPNILTRGSALAIYCVYLQPTQFAFCAAELAYGHQVAGSCCYGGYPEPELQVSIDKEG